MGEKMSICVNGQCELPPGFRFHPTEEELLQYYLRKKVSNDKIYLDVIREVDLNSLEPWDIEEKCRIGSAAQNDWYLFSHNDKKYPTGTRRNRATRVGFWKATGRDKVIHSNGKTIGMRKTLVFYTGRAPNGLISHWIMHEYRLADNVTTNAQEEGWVVCRVFKKKIHLKSIQSPSSFDQVVEDMASDYKEEKLPSLDIDIDNDNDEYHYPIIPIEMGASSSMLDWDTLDRLVASQLPWDIA